MSYRYVDQPARALQQALSSFSRRLSALEARTRWTGVARYAENLVVVPYGADTWTTVVSVDLDPGSWLIHGHANIQGTTSSLHWIRIPQSDVFDSGTAASPFGGFGFAALDITGLVHLSATTTVTLEAKSSAAGSTNSSHLTAIPI